jgi:hypothetical protein
MSRRKESISHASTNPDRLDGERRDPVTRHAPQRDAPQLPQRDTLYIQRGRLYPVQEWVYSLQWATRSNFFDKGPATDIYQFVGYELGFTHGGILTPEKTLRPDVTALVAFDDNQDAIHGYKAGRQWFFEETTPNERTLTEDQLIEWLHEFTKDAATWHDPEDVWFFTVGCLLGELSGHLFPATTEECEEWAAERLKFIEEYNQKVAQEHSTEPLPVITLQET